MNLDDIIKYTPIYRKFYRWWWFGRKRDSVNGIWVESARSFRKRLRRMANRKNNG